jgi:HEPN domain-containing protein
VELTKLEKVIVISTFVQGLGEEFLENSKENHSLKQLLREIEKVFNDSTPDQMREAAESVLEKFIYDLKKENNLPLLKIN